jgi:hypothetical protein
MTALDSMVRDLTVALEDLKTVALDVRLRERTVTQAAEVAKMRLKEATTHLQNADENADAGGERIRRQHMVVETLQARKELRVMLNQIISEMEQAKDALDRGLLFRSNSPLTDPSDVCAAMSEAADSATKMRAHCSAVLCRSHSGAAPATALGASPAAASTDSQVGASLGGGAVGVGGAARSAMLEEERQALRAMCSAHAAERLQEVVGALRQREEDMDFQAQLLSAQMAAGQSSGYSKVLAAALSAHVFRVCLKRH